MEPATTTALIAAGGAGASTAGSIFTAKKQRKHERKMALEAHNRNLAQWERENFYNSPAEVMKRKKAAGINPFEGVSGISGTASPATPYQQPDQKFTNPIPGIMETLSTFMDLRMKKTTNEGLVLDNKLKDATLISAIDKFKSESNSAWAKSSVDSMMQQIEAEMFGLDSRYRKWKSPTIRKTGQWKQREAEIEKSQADAKRARSLADYQKLLNSVGMGSQVMRSVAPFLQMLMK